MAEQATAKPTAQSAAPNSPLATRAGPNESALKQAYTAERTTLASTVAATSMTTGLSQTTNIEAKERVEGARTKLIAAATVMASIALIAAILVLVNANSSGDTTTADTELTYRELTTASTEATTAARTHRKATTTEAGTTAVQTTEKKRGLDARTLLCTYGDATNSSTVFPPDGLCDLIFFDSAYKGYKNVPLIQGSFEDNIKVFLSAAKGYQNTEFGVAFAYKYHTWMRNDLKNVDSKLLEVFWSSGVFHFGVIDMPAFGVDPRNISDALTTLKELSAVAMKRPDPLRQPYSVLGAATADMAGSYASKLRAVYTPTLFISQGHYAFGDNELPDCKMVPPTMLQKPAASQGYTYDLTDALSALQLSQDAGVPSKWLVSVTMKGRLTVAKNETFQLLSDCKTDAYAKSFGTYVEVCTSSFFRKKLKYFDSLEAAYTVNVFKKTMFVYDNEKGLCTKMCRLKSQNDNLQFGIAVFDLDYEDYNNSCTDLNVFGAFSRLKMVRKLVDYFRTPSASGARCESDVPCPKGAAN
ncbi:uncharacterized protein LOC144100023 [Amblyomma americanum]